MFLLERSRTILSRSLFMNVLLSTICRCSTLCRFVPAPENCADSSCNVYSVDPLHSEPVCWCRPTQEPSTRLTGAAPAGSNLSSTIVFAESHFWSDQIRWRMIRWMKIRLTLCYRFGNLRSALYDEEAAEELEVKKQFIISFAFYFPFYIFMVISKYWMSNLLGKRERTSSCQEW